MTLALAQLFLVWVVRAPRPSRQPGQSRIARVIRERTTLAVLATAALQLGLVVVPGVAKTLGLLNLGWRGAAIVVGLAADCGVPCVAHCQTWRALSVLARQSALTAGGIV